jgi:2-(1,2-epoxy-1,2-dihydrophenyl)acetyl-CoA isomerase
VVDDDLFFPKRRKSRESWRPVPRSLWRIKNLFLQTPNRSLESQLEDEAQTLAAISRTADALEGSRPLGRSAN